MKPAGNCRAMKQPSLPVDGSRRASSCLRRCLARLHGWQRRPGRLPWLNCLRWWPTSADTLAAQRSTPAPIFSPTLRPPSQPARPCSALPSTWRPATTRCWSAAVRPPSATAERTWRRCGRQPGRRFCRCQRCSVPVERCTGVRRCRSAVLPARLVSPGKIVGAHPAVDGTPAVFTVAAEGPASRSICGWRMMACWYVYARWFRLHCWRRRMWIRLSSACGP